MKPKRIRAADPETLVCERQTQRPIKVGDRFGNLKVVERVERDGRLLGYRVRCLNLREDKECGEVVFKGTAYLIRDANFRACKRCADEHIRAHRRRFTTSFFARHAGGGRG